MILIVTHKEDFTADFVIEKLNNKEVDYYRLNCEDINCISYCFESLNSLFPNINGIDVFTSVWFRRTKLPELNTENQGDKLFLLGDYEALFDNLWQLINSKRWLSHPNFVYRAENKIYQLSVAKSIGFSIPNTLLTNDHKALREFFKNNNNKIIIKPIRQGRIVSEEGTKTIFTNLLDELTIDRIEEFDLTPCIFQNFITKKYELRITVVGENVFSARINSQENKNTVIDWRKEKLPVEIYELPTEIKEKCILLTKKLGIAFGAIDMIKAENGDYVFLEINPNGQWAWIEIDTGIKISDAIINYLMNSNVEQVS